MARKMYKGASDRSKEVRHLSGSILENTTQGGVDDVNNEECAAVTVKEEIARALYDFTAEDSEEMSLKVGDLVTVVDKDGDWWQGKLRGRHDSTIGWFPAQ